MRWILSLLLTSLAVAGPAWADGQSKRLAQLRALSFEELLDVRVRGFHHTHDAGEWMLAYRYMFMGMQGNRSGTNDRSSNEVLGEFMVAPLSMDMHMHMLEAMYSPNDSVVLMVMAPYHQKSMDHVARTGARFTTRSEGIGDVSLVAQVTAFDSGGQRILVRSGLALPTGSTTRKDDTPMGHQRLPYPMQLGSGTYDPKLGISYLGQRDGLPGWGWGAELEGTLRLGRNRHDYSLGERIEVSTWLGRELTSWLVGSIRLNGVRWGNIDGNDKRLNPAVVPTAVARRRGGRRLDALLGFHFTPGLAGSQEHQFTVEVGAPIYQWLEGPQLETDARISASWAYTF